MTDLVSRPASSTSTLLWITLPAAGCALMAGVLAASDLNEAWLLTWNHLAATLLPPAAWAGITNLGSTLGAFALLTPALAWRPRWVAAALLAAPAASLYTHGLKTLFSEPRPAAVIPLDQFNVIGLPLRTDSFPSGHSLTAFVVAGVLLLSAPLEQRMRVGMLVLAAASLIAFSRVAVGAHWPLDLFAGAAGGWLCAAIGHAWSAHWRFWERKRGQQVLCLLMMLFAVAFAFEDLGYPEGLWMQYLLVLSGLTGAAFALSRKLPVRMPA